MWSSGNIDTSCFMNCDLKSALLVISGSVDWFRYVKECTKKNYLVPLINDSC